MIDRDREKLFPINKVPDVIAESLERGVSPPCYETVRQWASEGRDGVVLETTRMGRQKYTSREAMKRFFAALDASRESPALLPGQIDRRAMNDAARRMQQRGLQV